MDFSEIPGKIYFQGKFIPSKKARIHVLNHSLHFATSVFEGIAVYNYKPLFLNDHFRRFQKSSELMNLSLDIKIKKFKTICDKLIKYNKIDNGYIRPILFRSNHSMSPDTTNCKSILAIASWKWGKLFKKDGISLKISKYPKLNKKIFPIEAKSSGSYQSSVISKIEANKLGYDDCLMLDVDDNIAETTACNIFWVKNNVIYTPKENSILNGITRKCILEICKKKKIKVKIGNYKLKNILKSDNVFATGTAAEIQKITKIEKKKYILNSKITNHLINCYEKVKNKCPNNIFEIRKIL